jgi:Sec-independent protein translocase protein TatA
MTPLAFLDIGFPELCVVAFVGIALYGGRLPEIMRTLGAAYRKLKTSVESLTREATEVQKQMPRIYTPQPPKDPAALPRPASAVPAASGAPSAPTGAQATAGAPPAPAASPTRLPGPTPDGDDAPLV